MLSIYQLKPKFQKLLTPLLKYLHSKGITANQITVFSIFFSLIIGVCFWFADVNSVLFLALPIGLLIRMALNALDGMMARTYQQITKKGELLNELGDCISDVFIFFPLLKMEPQSIYWIVIFIVISILNEYAGIMGKILSNERRYEGPMGKSDRAFVIGLYGLLRFLGVDISPISDYIFVALILLLCLSTATRIRKTLANANSKK